LSDSEAERSGLHRRRPLLLELLRPDLNQLLKLLQLRRHDLQELLKIKQLLLLEELYLLELLRENLHDRRRLLLQWTRAVAGEGLRLERLTEHLGCYRRDAR